MTKILFGKEKTPDIVRNTCGSSKLKRKIDYSRRQNWLSKPEKAVRDVDVFYLYPASFVPKPESCDNVSSVNDRTMRGNARIYLNSQASVFSESCNIFAPFYRQLRTKYALSLPLEERRELLCYMASKDLTDALNCYFDNLNNKRPFILAGASQGAEMITYLLEDYFLKNRHLLDRMIAAYCIGYSVTEKYLEKNEHLKFASGERDTGVVVSWNTEGPQNIGKHNAVVLEGAKSINPLNWRTDETYAPKKDNLGSYIDGIISEGLADAAVNAARGTVITNADLKYSTKAGKLFGPASFHTNEYGLFYNNIKKNCKDRIEAFFKNNGRGDEKQ